MPQGCVAAIEPILSDFCLHVQGKSDVKCLDLGIGFGLWGALFRNYIDGGAVQFQKRAYILGVEGFAKYRSPCWDCYDHVHVLNISKYLSQFGKTDQNTFDGIFLLDVLEHFPMLQGVEILKKLRNLLNDTGRLYVTTPSILMEQGAAYGNPLEEHKSFWRAEDLQKEGFTILQDGKDLVGAGYYVLTGRISK